MSEIDSVTSLKSSAPIAKAKRAAKHVGETLHAKKSDRLTLSTQAKEMIDRKRFVDLLREMKTPSRIDSLDREYDFSSPTVLKEVARKIADEMI